MADLAHVVGQDLQLTPLGDLAVVTSAQETQQRVLHRLLTGTGSYIWHLSYGAGLPGLVGSVVSQQQVNAIIVAQMNYESGVAALPEPNVIVKMGDLADVCVRITYTDATLKSSQTLNLPMDG